MIAKILNQADDYIPIKLLRWIGGFRTYASRINFFLGIPNTLMIGILFYNDSSLVQSIFPNVYYWIGFILFIFVPIMVFLDRFLLHPSQIIYQSYQTARIQRNPIYKEVREIKKEIKELK